MNCAILLAVGCLSALSCAGADPTIEILSPAPGTITDSPTVLVSGNATPGTSVSVDGVLVFVDTNGSWSVRVALSEGSNSVHAVARDAGGNASNATIEIFFADPTADLRLDLEDAMDEIEGTNQELNQTETELAEAQSDLADVMANVSQLQDQLAETTADLADSRSDLAALDAGSGFAGPVGTALIVGLLGVVLGAAGVAMAFLGARKRRLAEETELQERP